LLPIKIKEESLALRAQVRELSAAKTNTKTIVFESAAPMEFKQHAAKYGIVLYEKSSSVFADFKQKVMIEYSDFAPYRAIFSNATLARIQP